MQELSEISYEGAPLKRFPSSDAMVLGGPGLGQLTILNPDGGTGPDGDGNGTRFGKPTTGNQDAGFPLIQMAGNELKGM